MHASDFGISLRWKYYLISQYKLYRLVNRLRRLRTLFYLLAGVAMTAFFFNSVRGEPFGLVMQDAEVSPRIAKIGEIVSIGVTTKNVGNNATRCNVTAFCGDCIVGVQEINVVAKSSLPLIFQFNTSLISAGVYSIEILVEKPSGQQKIFDLGTITLDQDGLTPPDVPEPPTIPIDQPDLTIPDGMEPKPSPTTPVSSNLLYLLPVVPAGAVASIVVLRKQRKKSQDPVVPNVELPNILNEILKFEDKVEEGISDEEKKYIC